VWRRRGERRQKLLLVDSRVPIQCIRAGGTKDPGFGGDQSLISRVSLLSLSAIVLLCGIHDDKFSLTTEIWMTTICLWRQRFGWQRFGFDDGGLDDSGLSLTTEDWMTTVCLWQRKVDDEDLDDSGLSLTTEVWMRTEVWMTAVYLWQRKFRWRRRLVFDVGWSCKVGQKDCGKV